ncbi:MAG TPA: hypothetical protein VNM43_04580 [Dehalococcoidia bacterium]|nr:hypothetical protein [Dehalococcoidia bacterium]
MEAARPFSVLEGDARETGAADERRPLASRAAPESMSSRRLFDAPRSVAETGLPLALLEELALKLLRTMDRPRLLDLADAMCLLPSVTQEIVESLSRRKLTEVDSADSPLKLHYRYSLTEAGKDMADEALRRCHYMGPAPVPVEQYSAAVLRQASERVRPNREQVRAALAHLVLPEETVDIVGQAYASGRPLMVYGPSGNGKSDIVLSVAGCIGGSVFIPYALYGQGHIIEVFDAQVHRPVSLEAAEAGGLAQPERSDGTAGSNGAQTGSASRRDARWREIRRPAIVVGGDMGPEALEMTFDTMRNVYKAPLSVRAQGGVLVIDDLGRQRVPIQTILNRWVQLMEQGYDSFSLQSSQVIRLPLDVTLVFSTNLSIEELMDEAYLRRISYKIPVGNPTREQFLEITRRVCQQKGVPYTEEALQYLVQKLYDSGLFEPKGCYPRDIIQTIVDWADYHGERARVDSFTIERACKLYLGERRGALARVA